MSRIGIKAVYILVKKVDVPDDQNDRKHEDRKGWRLGSTSRLSRMESKRLMFRTIKTIASMRIKKVGVSDRHLGRREWNQKG
jgi:hypothetical protein